MTQTEKTLALIWPKASDFAVAAELVRDGLVESRHLAISALVGPDGKLIDELGRSGRLIFPRSAVKPLQVVAVRRTGLDLRGAQLAITAGSHQGTGAHEQLIEEILSGAGLSVDNLQCPVAWPADGPSRAAAKTEKRAYFNCSGKHAGFLAACVSAGFPIESYLEENHPLQLLIREVLEEYAGEKILFTTTDGCGAPLHTLTLVGLARAIGKFSTTDIDIVDAMTDNAWAVDGHETADTILLEAGLVAKLGAEGVFVIGTRDGHGVAVKILDGQLRAAPLVALGMLLRNGLLEQGVFDELFEKLSPKVFGGNLITGRLEITF